MLLVPVNHPTPLGVARVLHYSRSVRIDWVFLLQQDEKSLVYKGVRYDGATWTDLLLVPSAQRTLHAKGHIKTLQPAVHPHGLMFIVPAAFVIACAMALPHDCIASLHPHAHFLCPTLTNRVAKAGAAACKDCGGAGGGSEWAKAFAVALCEIFDCPAAVQREARTCPGACRHDGGLRRGARFCCGLFSAVVR